MKRRVVIWALLALCAATPCTAKGIIRGRLLAPGQAGGDPAADTTASGAASLARGRLMDAVVYVDQVPDKVERKLAKKARRAKRAMVQQKLQFVPRVLAVAEGDTVRFENRDRVYHNAFSVSPARRFDLGKYPPGTVTRVAFDEPGVVNLHCDIHPKMAGFVVILGNHVFARPDSRGRYALPRLPRGTYTLKAWHPRFGSVTQQVEVPKKGDLILDMRF